MRELSLFSGAGGGLLGTKLLGWQHVGYVEWNDYCQRVIAARIADGYLDEAPIFTDVREFAQSGAAEQYRGIADVVSAGFPCQPFSVAGKQAGADDERNMWPATVEVIRRVQPRSVLLENVPGLISCGYLGTVLCDLAALGYVGRWGVIGARDVGAPHKRDRLWIVAHADNGQHQQSDEEIRAGRNAADDGSAELAHATSERRGKARRDSERSEKWTAGSGEALANTSCELRYGRRASTEQKRSAESTNRCEILADSERSGQPRPRQSGHASNSSAHRERQAGDAFDVGWWESDPGNDAESGVGRVAHGVAYRMDRLKAIGNGQVPAVVERAWRLLA